jgi:hypothetical protein
VDTEEDCTNIEALYTYFGATPSWINVSIFHLVFCYLPCPTLTSLLLCRNWLNILALTTNF